MKTDNLEKQVKLMSVLVDGCKKQLADKDARAKMLERAKEAEAKKARNLQVQVDALKVELEESRAATVMGQCH